MRQKTMQSATSYLGQGPAKTVVTHARQLARLQQAVLRALPDPLNRHCQVINVRQQCLVLSADSPAWAARLRYQIPELNARLNQKNSANLKKILIKTRPATGQTNTVSRASLSVSRQTGRLLSQLSADIRHPGLSAALAKLAAHSKKI